MDANPELNEDLLLQSYAENAYTNSSQMKMGSNSIKWSK